MTSKPAQIFSLFFFFVLSIFTSTVAAQSSNNKTDHEKFSFEYPADWRIVDKGSPGTQQYNLTPQSGNALIMVISFDAKIDYDRFSEVRQSTAQRLADKIFTKLNAGDSGKRADNCTTIENITFPGLKLTGFYDSSPSTAEIYYLAVNRKFYNFIYLRDDKESSKTDPAWNMILNSFSFKNLNKEKPDFIIDNGSDLVLNGRAKKLVRPSYPAEISKYGAPDIEVRITIDETGEVISAKEIAANKSRFAPYVENAAKASKFEPTMICGKPSKITGIIVYLGFKG